MEATSVRRRSSKASKDYKGPQRALQGFSRNQARTGTVAHALRSGTKLGCWIIKGTKQARARSCFFFRIPSNDVPCSVSLCCTPRLGQLVPEEIWDGEDTQWLGLSFQQCAYFSVAALQAPLGHSGTGSVSRKLFHAG